MSLIINSLISGIKALVVTIIEEAPKVLRALKEKVQEVRVLLETDGQHDRRIRELNRKAWRCELKALRGERRHGAPKERGLHPNQSRAVEALELKCDRLDAALAMANADPLSLTADRAFWAIAE